MCTQVLYTLGYCVFAVSASSSSSFSWIVNRHREVKKKQLTQAEYRAKYNAKKQASQGRSNAILNLKKEETQGHLKKQR